MDFTFSDEQHLFQSTVRDFLAKECTPEVVRALWDDATGHAPGLWAKLTELGIPGLLVPEAHGGMGLDEIDAVLLFEEVGRAALCEPVVATAAVAAPLLVALGRGGAGERAGRWLERIAAGEAIAAVGHPVSPFVADAAAADLLLLAHGDEVHALEPDGMDLTPQPANDPGRRLYTVRWAPSAATRLADGAAGRALQAAALDRGALACASGQLGVADRLIEMASAHACQREQFGVPIGSFQAVKHMLATAKVRLEYARPAVHRAAHSVARGAPGRPVHVSMAKVLACEAAALAARTALQVHGAIGYTWEQDLHLWMRRAWSLEMAWGRNDFHRRRLGDAILDGKARLGPGETFADDAFATEASN
jgi:alkylation response protein AidB-like acyl-CoA dehydrogenase